MSTYKYEYRVTCRNDCRMEGCPTHLVQIAANNTSDTLVYYNDGKIDFGMDFDELAEFIKHVHEMRGWVEIDNLFTELEKQVEVRALFKLSKHYDSLEQSHTKDFEGNEIATWSGYKHFRNPITDRIEELTGFRDDKSIYEWLELH